MNKCRFNKYAPCKGTGVCETFNLFRVGLSLLQQQKGFKRMKREELIAKIERLEMQIEIQKKAFSNALTIASKLKQAEIKEAQLLNASCNPKNINDERITNEILTNRVEELEAENEMLRRRKV